MKTEYKEEIFIVVDIETAGPTPGIYPLLSIGACTLKQPRNTFYIELQPDTTSYKEEALRVSNLSLEKLTEEGIAPKVAMERFSEWVMGVASKRYRPIFTAFNAPFDWMFVNEYFYRYLGYNPFGYSALDIKAYYMGMQGNAWRDTSYQLISERFNKTIELHHHALKDALDAAVLFEEFIHAQRNKEK